MSARALLRLSVTKLLGLAAICAIALVAPAYAAQPLRVGTDISHPPLEFYTANHRLRGFDVDIVRAIGAQLGRPIEFVNMPFSSLLGSVSAGRVDMTISSMFDLRVREKSVDFVDYFLSGTGIMVRAGNPKELFNLAGFCGVRASAELGTFQYTALQAQSKACRALGLGPIRIISVPGDEAGARDLLAGHADVHIADFPIVSYLALTVGNGKLTVAGKPFNQIPYGIATRKSNLVLRTEIASALRALVANGTYDRLLAKWHLSAGALRSVPIDAGGLYEH